MSIENPFEYSPLGKKPGEAGIAFSKIESNYNDQSFRMDFEAYASAHYKTRKPDRTYLLDKQQCDSFKENTFQDKHQNDFIKKFSSKDMALKIKFFGNVYKKLDPATYDRSKFTQKYLGGLVKNSKAELDKQLEVLKHTYIELRNSGKTHEDITT